MLKKSFSYVVAVHGSHIGIDFDIIAAAIIADAVVVDIVIITVLAIAATILVNIVACTVGTTVGTAVGSIHITSFIFDRWSSGGCIRRFLDLLFLLQLLWMITIILKRI